MGKDSRLCSRMAAFSRSKYRYSPPPVKRNRTAAFHENGCGSARNHVVTPIYAEMWTFLKKEGVRRKDEIFSAEDRSAHACCRGPLTPVNDRSRSVRSRVEYVLIGPILRKMGVARALGTVRSSAGLNAVLSGFMMVMSSMGRGELCEMVIERIRSKVLGKRQRR
jgi:hypothetical protein